MVNLGKRGRKKSEEKRAPQTQNPKKDSKEGKNGSKGEAILRTLTHSNTIQLIGRPSAKGGKAQK